jgi:hypothetical protein
MRFRISFSGKTRSDGEKLTSDSESAWSNYPKKYIRQFVNDKKC